MVAAYCDDRCLARMLRGNRWEYAVSEKQMHANLNWRFDTEPWKPCATVRETDYIAIDVYHRFHDSLRYTPGNSRPEYVGMCLPLRQCTQCLKNPYAHSLRVAGFDKLNRPIIYACFGQANDRWGPEENIQHVTCVLEQAVRYMDEMNKGGINRKHVEQWIWMVDFEGFSVRDCSPKTMILTKNVCRRMFH